MIFHGASAVINLPKKCVNELVVDSSVIKKNLYVRVDDNRSVHEGVEC